MTKRVDREGKIHRAILDYLRITLPGAVIHHPANEVDAKGKNIARAIAKNKWNGMLPGYPDLICHYQGRTFLFEVKAPGNYLTNTQRAVRDSLEANGIPIAMVRSIDEVADYLDAWGIK